MKKFFLAAFAALFSLTCLADDYYLNVIANATDSYATASLKKISFENGNVVVTTSDGASTSYAISSISQMYFSSTSGTPSFFVTIHCLVRIVAFFRKVSLKTAAFPAAASNRV